MEEGIYYAYSQSIVATQDKFGNIENEENLQSQYQEIYAKSESPTLYTPFKVGDKPIYHCINNGSPSWLFPRPLYIESVTNSEYTITEKDLKICFNFADNGNLELTWNTSYPWSLSIDTTYVYDDGRRSTSYGYGYGNKTENAPALWRSNLVDYRPTTLFNTNIPIFETYDKAMAYIRNEISYKEALNYGKIYDFNLNQWIEVEQFSTQKIAFVQDLSSVYDLRLFSEVDFDTVRWSTNGTEWQDSDSIKFNSYISEDLHKVDGFVYKSVLFQTNIPIFADEQTAVDYFNGDIDISSALNYKDISSGIDRDVALGEVIDGEMDLNVVAMRGAFCSRYAMDNGNLADITNKLFTDDETILQNVIDGLKLYGVNPMDSVIDLTYYPFDITQYASDSPQTYVYMGHYKLDLESSVNKIINLNTVIDCGKVNYPVTYGSYKDYEPYTELYVYLPYCGLKKLNISDYIGKTMGIKYGVDLTTGACEAFILSDGRILDRVGGQMGVRQFVTSMDSAQYASNVANSILNMGGNTISTGIGTIGNVASGNFGGALANLGSFALGGGKGLMSFKNAVENVQYKTRGGSTSMLNQFDIQYPYFIFVYSKVYECNDIDIVGKPSNAKSKVNNFRGFLKCADVKLESFASETEKQMIESLLKNGIYI